MKRLLPLVLTVLMVFSCGLALAEASADQATPEYSAEIVAFADALTAAGFEYLQTEPYFAFVGAIGGCKFQLGDEFSSEFAEVYQFDPEGEAFKKAVEENALTVEGFGISMPDIVVNGNLILYMTDCESREKVVEIFAALPAL